MLSIRPYLPDDALTLLALFRDTVRRVNCRDYSSAQIAAWASDEIDPLAWAARFAGRHALVAQLDGVPCGFCDLEHNGHLDRFFISADHQGQGIGSRLLNELVATARRLRMERLFLEASITARPFFAAHGFTGDTPQTVVLRGVTFINYRMERNLNFPVVSDL